VASSARRCPGGVRDHSAKVACAASTVRRASTRPPAAASVTARPVHGSMRWNVAPSCGAAPHAADQQRLVRDLNGAHVLSSVADAPEASHSREHREHRVGVAEAVTAQFRLEFTRVPDNNHPNGSSISVQ